MSPFVDDMPRSFQGFFAAVPILSFSFPGEWQSLHRSREHYGPSEDLGAVLFDAGNQAVLGVDAHDLGKVM